MTKNILKAILIWGLGTSLVAPAATFDRLNNTVRLGNGVNSDKNITVENGSTPKAAIRWDSTTNTWRFSNDGTLFKDFGSGSGGGINHLANGDGEGTTTGWTTFADSAGTSPVDGTGGSPTVTFTKTTSNPLRGNGMFVFTKDAANRQGEGVSYDYTSENADKGLVQTISFIYSTSANYVDDDMGVWIYRTTATARLIEPTPFKIKATGGNPNIFKANFQADIDATGYRLIFFQRTTNAAAYTVNIDNVSVGPATTAFGPVLEDWKDFTDFTIDGVTINVKRMEAKRMGDSLHVRGTVSVSGTSATNAAFVLSSLSVDLSKIGAGTNSGFVGYWYQLTNATQVTYDHSTTVGGHMFTDSSTVNKIFFSQRLTGQAFEKRLASDFLNAEVIKFDFIVPISGWSSGARISDDSDTRVVAARFEKTSAQSVLTTAVDTIDFDSESYDEIGGQSGTGTSWRWTANTSGKYGVKVSVGISGGPSLTAGEEFSLELWKNGVLYSKMAFREIERTAVANPKINGADDINLNSGDYIQVKLNNGTGVTLPISVSNQQSFISIRRLSGPAQITLAEKITVSYGVDGSTANAALADGATEIIDFNLKAKDSHNAVTVGATWKFTAPRSDTYSVCAMVRLGTATAASINQEFDIDLFKNNSTLYSLDAFVFQVTGSAVEPRATGCVDVELVQGDFIDVRGFQNTGGSVNISTGPIGTHIMIHSVGGGI